MIAKYLFDTPSGLALFSEFGLSAAMLLLSGFFVTQYSKKISEKMGLSRLWVGMMLLAPLSSAGEFISSISAITVIRAPDLAFGDLFGSNLFNLMILCFLIPVLTYRTPLLSMNGIFHERDILLAVWGIVLIVISMTGIFLTESIPKSLYFIFSLLIALIYAGGVRLLSSYEKRDVISGSASVTPSSSFVIPSPKGEGSPHAGLIMTWLSFFIWGTVMVFSGLWMTTVCDQISLYSFTLFGKKILLGHTFVGTIFLAIVTSLDEIVIAVSAIRLSASELTIGTIFGSNLVNLFFIPILDVIYRLKYGVHIFFDVRGIHLFTGMMVIALMAIGIGGILYRSKIRKGAGVDTIAMVLVYFVAIYMLFKLR